jgi:nitrous oxide reductase accessory protein NosL
VDRSDRLQRPERQQLRLAGGHVPISEQHGALRQAAQATDIGAIYVADYGTKAWADARKAFFHGSTARGPMNDPNLPAFATREAADAFAKAQGGKVLTFAEVTRDIIKSLNTSSHQH